MLEFFNNIDWNNLAEKAKTENILKVISSVEPVDFFTDPVVIISCIIAVAVMFYFKMEKTFSLLAGLIVMWIGIRYTLPKTEIIQLADIGTFALVFMGVVAFWVYMFFIKD